jgi:cyclophilin family peptidyl-prolyl cis-trans isomerase
VGTPKRERQKANRALREQQEARAATRRRGLRIGLIVAGAIVAVFALVWIVGLVNDDGGDTAEPAAGSVPEGDESAVTTPPSTEAPASTEECPPPDGAAEARQSFSSPPPDCLDPGASYSALVTTNKGEFTIDLDPDRAPGTVNNFVFLSRYGYYDDTTCHRIIPGFVVQCGDPTATGTGGPGYAIDDELPEEGDYELGSVAMANSGPNTSGSQFFIVTGDQGVALPPNYSLFGIVTEGFEETVKQMEALGSADGTPTEPVDIVSVEIVES